MHFDGNPLSIGSQDGAVTPLPKIGTSAGPHLLVGEESGRMMIYERSRLSCESYNRFPTAADGKKKAAFEVQDNLEPLSWEDAVGSTLGRQQEPEEEEQDEGEEQEAAFAMNLPRMNFKPKGIRPEFEPVSAKPLIPVATACLSGRPCCLTAWMCCVQDMLGEDPEFDPEASPSAESATGAYLKGLGCVVFGIALSHLAKPLMMRLGPQVRKMTRPKDLDRTV